MIEPPLRASDRLTRFLYEMSKFSNSGAGVHFRAFFSNDPELSVFETTAMAEGQVWLHGDQYGRPGPPAVGRADFECGAVPSILTVASTEPPPRHVSITGWPEKDHRKLLCQELASSSTPHPRPPSTG